MTARPRTAAMLDARRRDSATKRARVLTALEQMFREGLPITFASVARQAEVSSWLVYTPGVREAIEQARARQSGPAATGRRPERESPGAATDLALARAEITRLRIERDERQREARLVLGSKLDDMAKADLLARLDELTGHNAELAADAAERRAENLALETHVVELEDDLAAARASLRRMIRAENRPTERA